MTKDEALKMAIKTAKTAIKEWQKLVDDLDGKAWRKINELEEKLEDCREALEQLAQEPVGWMDCEGRFRLDFKTEIVRNIAVVNKEIPLYTHPAPSWQGLSDDEIGDLITHYEYSVHPDLDGFARAIEQALKEKNT